MMEQIVTPEFLVGENALLSGTYTGTGDTLVQITGRDWSHMHDYYFYDSIDTNGNTYYAAEKFYIAMARIQLTKKQML